MTQYKNKNYSSHTVATHHCRSGRLPIINASFPQGEWDGGTNRGNCAQKIVDKYLISYCNKNTCQQKE